MEKLIIENFGGLKRLEIEFKSINILIGPQASGKSIAVKLSYFFKTFFSEIFNSIESGETKRDLDKRQIDRFINYFPKDSWIKGSFKIEYENNGFLIVIEKADGGQLVFGYSKNLKEIIEKGRRLFKEDQKDLGQSQRNPSFIRRRNIRIKYNQIISSEVSEISGYNQYFIPAGRSFFANIQSTIFSFLSDNRSLDPFLIEFGAFYEDFKQLSLRFQEDKSKRKDGFDRLISQIMNGEYLREKEKDYLVHRDGRKVNLLNASSGQQETLPLVVVLKALGKYRLSPVGATLYIEEPEAHLFPTSQMKMVKLLTRTFNSKSLNSQIIVTTHSPYILSSFNNLLQAGVILESNLDNSELFNVVPEVEIIDPNVLTAYSLRNGIGEKIINDETRLISSNILDYVSDEISLEFGQLLDIE